MKVIVIWDSCEKHPRKIEYVGSVEDYFTLVKDCVLEGETTRSFADADTILVEGEGKMWTEHDLHMSLVPRLP